MRKLFLGAVALLAFASFGGMTVRTTIAAPLALDTQAAALQQQLDVMKASLINLQMQQGLVAGNDEQIAAAAGVAPTSDVAPNAPEVLGASTGPTLSPSDVAAMSQVLSALTVTLENLRTTLSSNQNLSQANQAAVLLALQGIGNTLGNLTSMIGSSRVASVAMTPTPAPVAMTAPSDNDSAYTSPAPVAVKSPTPTVTPSVPAIGDQGSGSLSPIVTQNGGSNAAPSAATPSAGTADASTITSFAKAHWPTIAIAALVIAILAILFWPQKEEEATTGRVAVSQAPRQAPMKPQQNQQQHGSQPQGQNMSMKQSAPAPVIHTAQPPKQDMQPAKVTIVRPDQEPKKKPA